MSEHECPNEYGHITYTVQSESKPWVKPSDRGASK